MPSRMGILMGAVLAAGIAAPGCDGRAVEAPAPPPAAPARPAEDGVRLMSELLKAVPTVLTIDGQSFLVMPDATYQDHSSSVTWQLYRYENGRFIRVEVLENLPPPDAPPPQ